MGVETVREVDSPETSGRIEARVLDGISAVPAADWDACLPPGSGPLNHAYLSAWECAELRGLASRPIVASPEGLQRPVAACAAHFYDLDIATVRAPGISRLVQAIRRIHPGFLFARTYEMGTTTPLANPFFSNDADLRPQAVEALIEAGLEEAHRGGAEFILAQNFSSRGGPVGEVLAEHGFAGVAILPTATMDLSYDSFDDYLGAMRSQYRRRAKQAFKKSEHLRIERLSGFEREADELAHLWRLIYERASEVKREALTPEYFRAASSVEGVEVLALRREDGTIASFGLLFRDQPWLYFLQCGFSEEAAHDEAAYFRLLYEIVRFGIDGGFDQLDLGVTTLEPKLDVGAVPIPLFAWVRHRNPIFRRIIRLLAAGPLGPPEAEPRHVFKEPPASAEEILSRRPTPA